jgi:hypothetical protein
MLGVTVLRNEGKGTIMVGGTRDERLLGCFPLIDRLVTFSYPSCALKKKNPQVPSHIALETDIAEGEHVVVHY